MSQLEEAIKHIEQYAEAEAKQHIADEFDPAGGVYVTVAGNHSLGISKDNRLIYFPSNTRRKSKVTDLGPASITNLKSLGYALERLEIHTIEE